MKFNPNGETKKTHRVATAEMADLNGYVDQREKAGTTSSEIAQATRDQADDAKKDLKIIEEELKKNWWKKATSDVGTVESVRDHIAHTKREFKERSDEEMKRKQLEAQEQKRKELEERKKMLINRPIMSNSDIVKKLAQESPPTKGKSTATPHSHSPFSLHVSSPPPDRTSTSSGLPPPPGRVTRYTTPAATQRTSTDSGRSNPSFDVESVSQASSERLSIHSHNTAESNATSLKHAPYDGNAWKPGHVRHQTEAFGPDSSRSEANLGRVASSSSSSSRGQHVGQSSRSHHITGSQANTGPSNYQQRQTTSLLAPLSCVPHSGNSEEDTDVDSLEEPHGHSYPSSSTLPSQPQSRSLTRRH